eukprot:403352984
MNTQNQQQHQHNQPLKNQDLQNADQLLSNTNLIHLQSYQQTQQFDDFKLSTARFEEMPLQYETQSVNPDFELANKILYQNQNTNNKETFYQSMIENQQFELKLEQLKVEKMRKEWHSKKDHYENQIIQLSTMNTQKSQILDRLESELKEMRQKVQFFYESYQNKEQECEESQKMFKEAQSDKFKCEVELAREREKNQQVKNDLEALISQNKQLKDQISELSQYSQKLDKEKNQIKQERFKEYERALEFLKIITKSSHEKEQDQIGSKNLNFMELFKKAIEQIFSINEKRMHSDMDLLEQRLKLTQQNMRKMKMEFQKVNSERLFYKSIYKKRIVNEALQDSTNHTVNQNAPFYEKQNYSQVKPTNQVSSQKSTLFQEVLLKQSKDVSDILGLVEQKQQLNQSNINTLQISPIKMFNLDRELSKGLSRLDEDQHNNYEISVTENDNTYEIDTFRSQDVEQALSKAQQLMKFKHDKEFINKVLDAQIRVNQIESNIIKNATTLSHSKRSVSKSSNKKPSRDNQKQTKYDYSAMTAQSRPMRN